MLSMKPQAPGLLESVYESALAIELFQQGPSSL